VSADLTQWHTAAVEWPPSRVTLLRAIVWTCVGESRATGPALSRRPQVRVRRPAPTAQTPSWVSMYVDVVRSWAALPGLE
jgi:hypothetical protein